MYGAATSGGNLINHNVEKEWCSNSCRPSLCKRLALRFSLGGNHVDICRFELHGGRDHFHLFQHYHAIPCNLGCGRGNKHHEQNQHHYRQPSLRRGLFWWTDFSIICHSHDEESGCILQAGQVLCIGLNFDLLLRGIHGNCHSKCTP